ncbi:ArsR family transcriptional regulator [Streptacidiphilus pinicola]|uniref:ArsR family transcriptional regulator n=1 Tax=Streptacidiphilus pinicola TaxID=2219663 RepID=A0A2X0I6K2_9ACTN|nr:helix-turn-helix domain-containing protein [Streptacidiphilus pinicola]RAG80574.1 ArsR family transcriptional regulator [Streptacidiphilus pinicola]
MEQMPGPRMGWTFLTNHARVLVQVARDPGVRVRDIAANCLLTERAVQRIISDLEQGGYLTHTRVGRANRYQVTATSPLRHPADAGPTVADLLNLLAAHQAGSDAPAAGEEASSGIAYSAV